ncbi:MAG: M48 family metallopeptidase [Bacteriovoracia bacterium]
MLYLLFMVLAIVYNIIKFRKERDAFLSSIVEAKHASHREMILGHHFYIFIFEAFLALIVAHLITERAKSIGILGLGFVYLFLVFTGFYLYQFFVRYVEKHTHLELYDAFKNHLVRELRVNFAMIMVPILVYSLINWAFQDEVYKEWGSLWFIGLLFNIIFVSVLTIVCSVIIMLRLIPNREITEPEYLEVINRRLEQIEQPSMRVRWIETDIKNAFVVGLKLLSFSNQTMFIGRSLRNSLTLEEFDAVIAHELAHVANRHIHKRVIDLLKNFISVILGIALIMFLVLGISFLYWGEDSYLHTTSTTMWCVGLCLTWLFLNYALLFDTIRSHEFEADGYAVIVLKARYEALESALHKLTTPDELPEYLKAKTQKRGKKNSLAKWMTSLFSTHPELSLRLSFLKHKINTGLPFNYYISPVQKTRRWVGGILNWKVSVPLSAMLVFSIVWTTWTIKRGQEHIAFINKSSPEEIMKNKALVERINSRPLLVGQTLIYFIVKKENEQLLNYFIKNGADKGKTLFYISQLKDFELFQKYYAQFHSDLSDDEYFLILRKTAQMHFTEGYRLLVNAKRFEDLHPVYKEDVSRLHESSENGQRSPASIESEKKD